MGSNPAGGGLQLMAVWPFILPFKFPDEFVCVCMPVCVF